MVAARDITTRQPINLGDGLQIAAGQVTIANFKRPTGTVVIVHHTGWWLLDRQDVKKALDHPYKLINYIRKFIRLIKRF